VTWATAVLAEGEGCGDAGEDHGLRGMCEPSTAGLAAEPAEGVDLA
jgi:hypothetical protein